MRESRTLLALGVVALLLPAGVGLSMPAPTLPFRSAGHSTPPVGPYDPLIGAPGSAVPRFSVSTAHLHGTNVPSYLSGRPTWLAYNPSDQSFWVATLPSTVTVLPASFPDTIGAVIPVGQQPFGVAVDPALNEVFITNTGSDNVTVVPATPRLVPMAVGVGARPMGIAFDPTDGEMFVANEGSNNVSVLSTTSLSVVATVPVGLSPIAVAYDAVSRRVFVADHGSYDVRAISTITNTVVATTMVGIAPYGVAVDDATDNVYVTNEGSGNVSVIHATSGAVVASIPVVTPGGADLQGIAYNPGTGQVWVGAGLIYLVILNTSSESVAYIYSTDPSGVAYDPDLGMMCLTNTFNATFQCLSQVSPYARTVPITFNETGLPNGTSWSVAEYGGAGLESNRTSIVLQVCPGSVCAWMAVYRFVVCSSTGEWASPSEPTVDAQAGPATVNVSFTPGPSRYPVTFNESGLATGLGWNVEVNGALEETTRTTVALREPDGSYDFLVSNASGYSPAPASGTVSVLGGATYLNIQFSEAAGALVANISYRILDAGCLPDDGVTNDVSLNATAGGGAPPYSYLWTLPTGSAIGPFINATVSWPDGRTVSLNVTDSNGVVAHASVVVSMWLPPCPHISNGTGAASPTPNWWLVGVVVAVGGALIVVAAGIMIRRRRKMEGPP